MPNDLPDAEYQRFWKRLQQIGLNAYEARSYLVLVGHPRFKALELVARSHVPRQKIYEVLDSLVEKGFAQVVQEKTKLFSAVEPSLAIPSYFARRAQAMQTELSEQSRQATDLIDVGDCDDLRCAPRIVDIELGDPGCAAVARVAISAARIRERRDKLQGHGSPGEAPAAKQDGDGGAILDRRQTHQPWPPGTGLGAALGRRHDEIPRRVHDNRRRRHIGRATNLPLARGRQRRDDHQTSAHPGSTYSRGVPRGGPRNTNDFKEICVESHHTVGGRGLHMVRSE